MLLPSHLSSEECKPFKDYSSRGKKECSRTGSLDSPHLVAAGGIFEDSGFEWFKPGSGPAAILPMNPSLFSKPLCYWKYPEYKKERWIGRLWLPNMRTAEHQDPIMWQCVRDADLRPMMTC